MELLAYLTQMPILSVGVGIIVLLIFTKIIRKVLAIASSLAFLAIAIIKLMYLS